MTVESGARERGVGRSYTERPRRCSFWARRSCGCCGLRIRSWSWSTSCPAHRQPGARTTRQWAAVAATLLALWVPVPPRCGLPTVHQECAALDDDQAVAPLPPRVVRDARVTLDRLLRDPVEDRVLHGDLHPQNLLWAQDRGWVAIDPHGVVGDPGYDVGPLLINPWNADPVALLDRRLPLLAQLLGMTVERVAAWGLVRAVLAEAWHVQDTEHTAGGALAVAERLTQVVSSDR